MLCNQILYALLSTANFINFELARCYSNRRKNKRYNQRRQLTKNINIIDLKIYTKIHNSNTTKQIFIIKLNMAPTSLKNTNLKNSI